MRLRGLYSANFSGFQCVSVLFSDRGHRWRRRRSCRWAPPRSPASSPQAAATSSGSSPPSAAAASTQAPVAAEASGPTTIGRPARSAMASASPGHAASRPARISGASSSALDFFRRRRAGARRPRRGGRRGQGRPGRGARRARARIHPGGAGRSPGAPRRYPTTTGAGLGVVLGDVGGEGGQAVGIGAEQVRHAVEHGSNLEHADGGQVAARGVGEGLHDALGVGGGCVGDGDGRRVVVEEEADAPGGSAAASTRAMRSSVPAATTGRPGNPSDVVHGGAHPVGDGGGAQHLGERRAPAAVGRGAGDPIEEVDAPLVGGGTPPAGGRGRARSATSRPVSR